MASWKYLTRFTATDWHTYLASLPSSQSEEELTGSTLTGFATLEDLENQRGKQVTVKQLVAPVPYEDGDIVCIGINYREHAKEANLTVPPDPVMWYKPKRALAGPGKIPIPPVAANGFLDFEGELTIVTGKDARDISIDEAPNYILGYTVGNDLTARVYQDPRRGGGQFTKAKAFDKFAPLGPVLVNAKIFGEPGDKKVVTKVNGQVFQDSACDLINGPARLLSFLSEGTTIPKGTVIMTGSPPGVGFFKNPKYNLKDGDVVEITITSIGTLKNTVSFL